MLAIGLLALSLGGIALPGYTGLPVAPSDIAIGRQAIELRQPLHAKSPGARLVLLVRNTDAVAGGDADPDRVAAFRAAVPPGSVVARLNGPQAEPLTLHLSAYTFHRGHAGIVLGDPDGRRYRELYDELEIESSIPLSDVRIVWLSRGSRRIEDLVRF